MAETEIKKINNRTIADVNVRKMFTEVQNDEGQPVNRFDGVMEYDNLLNKTHYDHRTYEELYANSKCGFHETSEHADGVYISDEALIPSDAEAVPTVGDNIRVKYNGTEYYFKVYKNRDNVEFAGNVYTILNSNIMDKIDDLDTMIIASESHKYPIAMLKQDDGWYMLTSDTSSPNNVSIDMIHGDLLLLDSKYIADDIKSVQSDYSNYIPNSKAFIKNKPDYSGSQMINDFEDLDINTLIHMQIVGGEYEGLIKISDYTPTDEYFNNVSCINYMLTKSTNDTFNMDMTMIVNHKSLTECIGTDYETKTITGQNGGTLYSVCKGDSCSLAIVYDDDVYDVSFFSDAENASAMPLKKGTYGPYIHMLMSLGDDWMAMLGWMDLIFHDIEPFAAPQGDWNETNPSKGAYIKNKPFYNEEISRTVALAQTDLTGFSKWEEGLYGKGSTIVYALQEGAFYDVTFDGTTYENLKCFLDEEDLTIGAPYGDFSIYPFGIYQDNTTLGFFTDSTSSSHSFKIDKVEKNLKCIDDAVIPETIARVAQVESLKNEIKNKQNSNLLVKIDRDRTSGIELNTGTASHSFTEIVDAINNGKTFVAISGNRYDEPYFYAGSDHNSKTCYFGNIKADGELYQSADLNIEIVTIDADKNVTFRRVDNILTGDNIEVRDISNLKTKDKTLVGAINELKSKIDELVDGNEVEY